MATAAEFIAEEKKYLGEPYVYGGDSPGGFDCSGLVMYCLRQVGVTACPRTTYQQYPWCEKIRYNELAPGDLIFEYPAREGPDHVVTYLGNGQVIEAAHSGEDIRIRWWSTSEPIVGYGRVPGLIMGGG